MNPPTKRTGWLKRLLVLPTLPIRLYNERTSVQLIVSHVAVVLLTLLLFYAAIIASIVGPVPFARIPGITQLSIDPFLGEQTRAYAQWMQPDRLEQLFESGVDADESAALDQLLITIISGDIPGFDSNGGEN
ncbi:MAG: hypothetical protein WKF81_04335, partial [Thermomicrobiales bacterium]